MVETLDLEPPKKIWKQETLEGALLSFRSLQNKSIRAATSKKRDEHKNKSYKRLCKILLIYSQMKIKVPPPTSLSTKYFVESFQAKQMQQ